MQVAALAEASHALRADPVQGTGARQGQGKGAADGTVDVKDLFTGAVSLTDPLAGHDECLVQSDGTAEVGLKASDEIADRLKVVVTGEAEAQIQMADKGAVDGVDEPMGEMDSGFEAANERGVDVGLAGLAGGGQGYGVAWVAAGAPAGRRAVPGPGTWTASELISALPDRAWCSAVAVLGPTGSVLSWRS
jgi:hypothetical protein